MVPRAHRAQAERAVENGIHVAAAEPLAEELLVVDLSA